MRSPHLSRVHSHHCPGPYTQVLSLSQTRKARSARPRKNQNNLQKHPGELPGPAPAASGSQAAGGIQSPHLGNRPHSRAGSPPSRLTRERPPVGTASPFSQQRCVPTRYALLTLALRADQGISEVFAPGPHKVRGLKVRGRSGPGSGGRTARRLGACAGPGQQALTRLGRGRELQAPGMRGPAPGPEALPPSRGPGGLPITALHDRGLRGHSTPGHHQRRSL